MPSLPDGIVIFVLALLLFGPKKLPVLARELGKWLGEFRRASNEFKMQMEDELRLSEQAERDKKLAAIEASAPMPPALEGIPTGEPEHPHTPSYDTYGDSSTATPTALQDEYATPAETPAPEPIATAGDLRIMPPSTGLPTPRTSTHHTEDDHQTENSHAGLGPLLDSIPVANPAETEGATHAG